MNLKRMYRLLAIVGAIIAMLFFLNFGANEGIDPSAFEQALFVNSAAGGLDHPPSF